MFTEGRCVFRSDGTLRLNISDAYAGKYKSGLQESAGDFVAQKNPNGRIGQAVALNNKFGIPWIPVFALRDTGRYLHNDIIRMKDKIALFS